jgi:hypothetical protein
MKRKLPILALLWVIAGPMTPIAWPQTPNLPGGRPDRGQILLRQAIFALESRHSISAEIGLQIDLFDKHLLGRGVYREDRSGLHPLVRLELKMPLGDAMGTLVQVCDGEYLWTYRQLHDDGKLTRVNLARVAKALEQEGETGELDSMGQIAALGGLPRMLRGLESAFHFDASHSDAFHEDSVQETVLHGVPVWRLCGRWKPDRLAKILPNKKDATRLDKLPPHLPDRVVLMLGKQDLFPYRIEYRRGGGRDGRPESPPGRTIVAVQLLNVSLNVPIDPAMFVYRPGAVTISDRTESFIKRLTSSRRPPGKAGG